MIGENCSMKKKSSEDRRGLSDLVLSWKVDDILDDNFYKHKIKKIPESFESLQHYSESYVDTLLEETRVELSSSLNALSKAPFAKLASIESKSRDKLLFEVTVDSWKSKLYTDGKEPYRPLPGDTFIILDYEPESITMSQCRKKTWSLVWLQFILDGTSSLQIQSSADILVDDSMHKELYLVFLKNMLTNTRIWRSLKFHGNVKIIKHLLGEKLMRDEICWECSMYANAICAEKMVLKLSTELNESQKAAIQVCLCKMLCVHKPSVELIWGPPGTGKTKTVSMLLWTILEMKSSVLVCAATNVAITELASRVVKLLKESREKGDLFCSLGDLLLHGNKDRLKVGSELEDIYLDHRVDMLMECLGAQNGWRYHINSMIKLLEDCYSLYHEFLEQKQGTNEVTSLLGFLRKRFRTTASGLRQCLQILNINIPRQFILEHNLQKMNNLVKVVDSIEFFLSRDDMVSEELETLLSYSEEIQNNLPNYFVYDIFLHFRIKCLSELKNLLNSLDHLPHPNSLTEKSVEKFIYQRASMIFCTASSSYKLNSKKMEPIDVLIIDEAAQLKECESTIPLQLPGIRHAILIGDESQLPAMVNSQVSEEAGFGRSLFERLSRLGHPKHLLNVQYRMHPSLSCFPNSQFYANQILNAPNVMDRSYEKCYLPGSLFGPFSFINVSAGKEERNGVGTSLRNMVEVAVLLEIIKKLHKEWSISKRKLSIGVISPYTAQIVAILDKLGQDYEKQDGFTVKVKSVDGFQGGEEDVIVISAVRSNSGNAIGFLSNPQRINVALTRARHCLWILGDERTLGNSNSDWEAVIQNAKDRHCFFNVDEDEDLANAVIEAKIDLLQFDDLLIEDSILFKKARWKVLFSNNFRESFLQRLSPSQKKTIMVFLLRLSGGWRPEKGRFSFFKGSDYLKHVKVEDMYITYSIDIEKDSKYIQVLKIWDIKPPEEVQRLDKCLSVIFGMYTDDFLNRCKVKCKERYLEVPLSWSASSNIVSFKDNESEGNCLSSFKAMDSKTIEKLLQMRFQTLSYRNVNYLLSDQQFEIILSPKSTFIIGRPGSEKTSCLAIKMFQREQRQKSISQEGINGGSEGSTRTALRQLFITVTSKQCFLVKQHLSSLKSNVSGGHLSAEISTHEGFMHDIYDEAQFSDTANSFLNVSSNSYPLVITFWKFLMMLDRSVGDSYFLRFHKLCELSDYKSVSSLSTSLQRFIRRKEVSFNKFVSSYWPNFDSQLTKKLDAFMVFNEIISQIKGGFRENEAHDSALSRNDYALLCKGRFSTLSKKRREKFYDIFLDYEKRKTENGEYDLADLVIDLHHRLRNIEYLGQKMDFLYLDEVQDLSIKQISLFKFICKYGETGVVFSANTTQTILRGFDFRFQDIRLLFYREFVCGSVLSEIVHLSQNIHTQPKVLRLGQSIMDLLFRFFPLCIDILSPETSGIDDEAETPILVVYEKGKDALKTLLNERENVHTNVVRLGPQQVILVRDDLARKKINGLVGNRALVLTIMECQCLEFEDVLLYDFFGSSPLEKHWNVVYEYMEEQSMLDIPFSGSFPSFNHEKYKDLCWELKLLYVAITRSRNRLWICVEKQTVSNPIFDYWKKLSLVQVKQFDKSVIEAVHGRKEEWSSRGLELFSEGIFGMAAMCFQIAEDIYREKWAKAASLRVSAENMIGAFPEAARIASKEASDIFNGIGNVEVAAQCLIESKEYEKAAILYLTKCGEEGLEDAGDCYALAECYEMAAKMYSRGKYFTKLIHLCTFADIFDVGLQVIQQWGEGRESDANLNGEEQTIEEIKQMLLEKGALHFHQIQNHEKMMNFVRAFNCMDLKRSFLQNLNRLDDLLETHNFVEAAQIAMKSGDLLLEISLLEKAGLYRDASSLILHYACIKSLWDVEKQGWPLKMFKEKEELLEKAKLLAMKESNDFYKNVCVEANILSNKPSSLSDMIECSIYSRQHGTLKGLIMSTWIILDLHLSSKVSNYYFEHTQEPNLSNHAEDSICRNNVSSDSLFNFWNIWTMKILDMTRQLGTLGNKDGRDYCEYEEFYLGYFGVRKEINTENITHLLVNPGAAWIMKVDDDSPKTTTNLVSLDQNQFFLWAKSYWYSEILSVGMKVLKKIADLQKFSIEKPLDLFFRCSITVQIYKVCQVLTDDEYLKPFIDSNTLQEIFNIGLESILFFRKHQSPSCSLVDEIEEVDKTSHCFLFKCALHYHEQKDVNTMLKFVGAFCSVESRRSFLKSFGHFKELLSPKLEVRNHTEAIAIAQSKGDLLLEVDLLHKNGQHEEATKLILIFVLANSLWGTSSKGWPLKPFKQREELLLKAKSYAKHHSDNFSNIVCTEVSLLYEMKNQLIIPQKNRNITIEILLARKILDAHIKLDASKHEWENEVLTDPKNHLEDKLYCEKLSVEMLVCYWNIWKDKINQVIRFFEIVEAENTNISMVYEESSLNYLGARKWLDNKSIYQLLIPDAYWVKGHVDKSSLQRNGDIVTINGGSLAFAAQKFWSGDVIFVGMQVLKHLGTLQIYSVTNHVSVFHKVSFHLAQVSYFLREFISKSKFPVGQKLSRVLESSSECFFNCVFSLDWIKPVTHDMAVLRETGIFTGLFEEFILKSINSESKLTNEKIGKVVMAVFGSKMINYEIYEKIAERLTVNPPWKAMIDEFRKNKPPESMLIFKLHEALKDYYSKWKKEINPISPNCFFYIIERQFIFVSSLQGCFYTTRSSFIEWLIAGKTNKNLSKIPSFGEIYDFIADMVNQFLFNDCGAREWIKTANLDSKQYYPLFLLRLIILMCLLCANSDKYYDMLYDLVFRHNISSRLPAKFNVMLEKRRRNDGFVLDLSNVLWKMKNPLVRVDYTGGCRKSMAKKLIDVSLKNDEKEEDLLRVVFGNRNSDEKMKNSSKGKTQTHSGRQ